MSFFDLEFIQVSGGYVLIHLLSMLLADDGTEMMDLLW